MNKVGSTTIKGVRYLPLIWMLLFLPAMVEAQRAVSLPADLRYRLEGTDTIYYEILPEVTVITPRKFSSDREYRQYYKMVYNLRKVYPYSQLAKRKLIELNQQYLDCKTDKERKAYAKKVEKELFTEFEAPLRKLSVSQGKILIKLIDRETGQSSYELIKELKGGFNAFFWQTTAKLFGNDLKKKYDKYGDDKILEELVLKCEDGTFQYLYYSMFGDKK